METVENKKHKPTKEKKGRQRYLPYNKPVKKKGAYPLRPGVQGFFITCDGGRERQASLEAINVLDSFYEELVHGNDKSAKLSEVPNKPLNKKIKFSYSDEEEDDDKDEEGDGGNNDDVEEKEVEKENISKEENKSDSCGNTGVENEQPEIKEDLPPIARTEEDNDGNEKGDKDHERPEDEASEPPAKKLCVETNPSIHVVHQQVEEKSIDRLIEEELKELGDKNKRLFINLDSGCNGVTFIQMRKRDGDPSPKDIVQHMMTSTALTRKHMSRFILRVLPIEVACYASEEEITKSIAPLVAKYFPMDSQEPQKFAVLYEARANTGIDRMKIIDSVAKSVPRPHKVDLSNPTKTIVVQIVKTVCLIGVLEKYKEFAKYNLRQLTS